MKYLISFANDKFKKAQELLEMSAYKMGGIDKVINYSPEDYIGTNFYYENAEILELKRGCGYWLWKPWIILDALSKIQKEDSLIYADAGNEVINDLSPLFALCDEKKHVILFENSPQHKNIKWTRSDTFNLMECNSKKYKKGRQLTASFVVVKKNSTSLAFLNEWFNYCKNPKILTDIPSEERESSKFIDHRHDQSVLSLLAIKHELEVFRDPSQWGNARKDKAYRVRGEFVEKGIYDYFHVKKNSPYAQLFEQNRGNAVRVEERLAYYRRICDAQK